MTAVKTEQVVDRQRAAFHRLVERGDAPVIEEENSEVEHQRVDGHDREQPDRNRQAATVYGPATGGDRGGGDGGSSVVGGRGDDFSPGGLPLVCGGWRRVFSGGPSAGRRTLILVSSAADPG